MRSREGGGGREGVGAGGKGRREIKNEACKVRGSEGVREEYLKECKGETREEKKNKRNQG